MGKNHPVGGKSARGATGDRSVCRWFLALYSDYRDDRLEAEPRAAVIAHIGECSSCRRYDRVIRTGVAVLRDSFEGPTPRVGGPTPRVVGGRLEDAGDGGRGRRAARGSDPSLSGIALTAIVVAIALNGVASWGAGITPTPAQAGMAVAAPAEAGPTAAPVSFPLPPSLRIPLTVPEGDGSEAEVEPPRVRVTGTVPADRD